MNEETTEHERQVGESPPWPDPDSLPDATVYEEADEIAHYLIRAFSDGGLRPFDVEPGGTLDVDITALTAEGQQLARWALEAWTGVTDIHFRFVSDTDAHITFDDVDAPYATGGHAISPEGRIVSGHVNIPLQHLNPEDSLDVQALRTYLHEIGHALGLTHPGDYSASDARGAVSYPTHALFANDSIQATVMSYFSQPQNTHIDADFAYPITPMIVDIIAIQGLYGVPDDIRSGDTVYGVNSNVGGYLGELFAFMTSEHPGQQGRDVPPMAWTVHDTGGVDVIDFRTDTQDQRVDLRPEAVSDVFGLSGNMVVARNTVIENYVGGSGNDLIRGNAADNRLEGRAGHDTLVGGAGNDRLVGGPGMDRLIGGPGLDIADYGDSSAAVSVDLVSQTASGGNADGDVISEMEGVIGSPYADRLIGNAADNVLFGAAGVDTLSGGAGNDRIAGGEGGDHLAGGPGRDLLDYSESNARVIVNLDARTASGGHAEGDVATGFEGVIGSAFDDWITGSAGANHLYGSAGGDFLHGRGGNDRLDGGAGADRLIGGPGRDMASYADSFAGVVVNLSTHTLSGGHAEGDTLSGIEDLAGSIHADRLTGNGQPNRLFGDEGDDSLAGKGGNDRIHGGSGNDSLQGGAGNDTLFGQHGDDYLNGGAGSDRLIGGAGNDRLIGGAGADRLVGGSGRDTADYRGSPGGVAVDLATGAASGGHAGGDTLSGIEDLNGSAHGDTLTGNGLANQLLGAGGNDHLAGKAGDDVLRGGPGNDTLWGGSGHDVLWGEAGSDRLSGNHGHDTLRGGVGNDVLWGGSGDDYLEGGAGADRLDGGPGRDMLEYTNSDAPVTVNLESAAVSGGHAQGDAIIRFEGVRGSAHDDRIVGDAGSNELHGGPGADRLEGGNGNDRISGGAGADTLLGGAGRDTLDFSQSPAAVEVRLRFDTASGGHAEGDIFSGFENVHGSVHDDFLFGNSDANVLDGNDGNDNLIGHAGDDVLRGGDGDDNVAGGPGSDRLSGGSGHDVLNYWDSASGVTVNLATGTARGGDAEGDEFIGFESIFGSNHGDRLTGDDGSNRLYGFTGDDRIDGGAGDDQLWGNEGEDVFVFQPGHGSDWVIDFTDGSDRIDLSAFSLSDISELMVSPVGTNVVINAGEDPSDNIILPNMDIGDVDASDFIL